MSELALEVALEVRGLTRRYGGRTAVNNLDLTVHKGDVYGFLGPNGAGKTTAMRMMLELIHRDSGTVRFFGETNLVKARQHVGAIIEIPAFHEWLSGRDNLELACAYAGIPRSEQTREIDRVLDRVSLKERAEDRAGTYSLGMKQRLGIARALLGRPQMLMLDEPTNGLDPRGMREMRDLIRSFALHDQMTVLISSHMLSEVQATCNRVGVIQAGTLRGEGVVSELLADKATNLVEVGCKDGEALARAVADLPEVGILGPGEAGRTRLRHGTMELSELNRKLVHAGLDIDSFVPVQRNLEDVFLEMTR